MSWLLHPFRCSDNKKVYPRILYPFKYLSSTDLFDCRRRTSLAFWMIRKVHRWIFFFNNNLIRVTKPSKIQILREHKNLQKEYLELSNSLKTWSHITPNLLQHPWPLDLFLSSQWWETYYYGDKSIVCHHFPKAPSRKINVTLAYLHHIYQRWEDHKKKFSTFPTIFSFNPRDKIVQSHMVTRNQTWFWYQMTHQEHCFIADSLNIWKSNLHFINQILNWYEFRHKSLNYIKFKILDIL